jgi:hypothetical protein
MGKFGRWLAHRDLAHTKLPQWPRSRRDINPGPLALTGTERNEKLESLDKPFTQR